MSSVLPNDAISGLGAGDATDRDCALFVESSRTRLLFAQARTGTVVTTLVSVAVVTMFWRVAPTPVLAAWVLAMAGTIAWRFGLAQRNERERPGDTELAPWRRRFIAGAATGGLVFGVSAWLLAPHGSLELQMLLAFMVAGMGVGAIPVLGSVTPAFTAYVGALFAPTILWLLAQGTHVHVVMGTLGLILFGALLSTARNYGRVLEKSLVLAYANSGLEDGLNHERATSHALRERAQLLRDHQSRLRDFADMGADLFWESDADLRYTYVSDSYHTLVGIGAERLLGRRLDDPLGPCLVPTAHLGADASMRSQPFREHHVAWTRPDGATAFLLSNGRPIYDEDGEFLGLRGTVKDFTEQHRLAEALKHQANHDHLTGLVNRREFERRFQRLLESARTTSSEHAVCFVDLDQFKIVNDTCGHAAGDDLLRRIATMLARWVRGRDTLARLGGDEFGLLLEHCSAQFARSVGEKLRAEIEELRFQTGGRTFRVSASVGIAPITCDSESVTEVMANVDAACFAAKEGGRNRVYLYEPDDEELAQRHGEMQWVTHITHGMEEDCFELAAQPIVALHPGASPQGGERLEILLRMRASDGALVLPGAFLPSAERYNLSTRLDRTVVEKTLAWLGRDRAKLGGLELCSVNLSGHTLMDSSFPRFLTECFERHRVPPGKICFEITETAAITQLGSAAEFIDQVHALGCEFSLDDFGTGLSSFAYLKSLQVDYIKIDGLFVRESTSDPVSLAMVRSIHDIGRVMGKRTIAEYVENEEILGVVRAVGVDYAQGFAIGRPEVIAGSR